MTQQVFADFLQQSPATLSSIFNGRTRPTINVIEAIKAKIPENYDLVLKSMYGDYMSLPPEEERRTHVRHVEYR